MECLRYLPFLSKDGWIITNTTPFVNIPNYPDMEKLMAQINSYQNVVAVNADELAKKNGSPKSSNVVLLGAAAKYLDIPFENLESGIKKLFGRKGDEVVNKNIESFRAGAESVAVR